MKTEQKSCPEFFKKKQLSILCKTCQAGTCCYEGVELTQRELLRIIEFKPRVAKPWFRLVDSGEEPDEKYPFATVLREGSCVFQDENNRCMIYPVRPFYCRQFPFEKRKLAPYFKRLCVLCRDQWPNNIIRRTYLLREKK